MRSSVIGIHNWSTSGKIHRVLLSTLTFFLKTLQARRQTNCIIKTPSTIFIFLSFIIMCLVVILRSVYDRVVHQRLVLYHTGVWTTLMVLIVTIASIFPEIAFFSSMSFPLAYSQACDGNGYVRIPLDMPREKVCLPADMLKRSVLDILIPALCAPLIVVCSAFVLQFFSFS